MLRCTGAALLPPRAARRALQRGAAGGWDQAAKLALLDARRDLVLAARGEDGSGDAYNSAVAGTRKGTDADGDVEDDQGEEEAGLAAVATQPESRRRVGTPSQEARDCFGSGGGAQRREAASAVPAIYLPGPMLGQRSLGRVGAWWGAGAGISRMLCSVAVSGGTWPTRPNCA